MNAPLRRGACPSLSAPMETGDGLLVRLHPVSGALSPQQLLGMAAGANIFGNGLIEVTQRGSLQIRGLTAESVSGLGDAVDILRIAVRTGLPIDVSALSGLDPTEIADARPLAAAIDASAKGLSNLLGPKVSVIVDGGGHSALDSVKADVRLKATRCDGYVMWQAALAGDAGTAMQVGSFRESDAADFAKAILLAIAKMGRTARARDLFDGEIVQLLASIRSTLPTSVLPDAGASHVSLPSCGPRGEIGQSRRTAIGSFDGSMPLLDGRHAVQIAIPFGAMQAPSLAALVKALAGCGVTEFRLAPGRGVFVLCATQTGADRARQIAGNIGFIVGPNDPRNHVVACSGAPMCGSGRLETRSLAERLAANLPAGIGEGVRLHVSGCEKRCAQPGGTTVSIVGAPAGVVVTGEGAPVEQSLRAFLSSHALPHLRDRAA